MEPIGTSLDLIGKIRRQLGLTQKELAKKAGVSQSLIAKIESGRIDPAYSKVVQLFQALEFESHSKENTLHAKDIMTKSPLSVTTNDTLETVMRLMKEKSISQLPVFEKEKVVGSLSDNSLVDWVTRYGNKIAGIRVREAMEDAFPTVPSEAKLDLIIEMLKFYKAVLVSENSLVVGIISKADLIKAMKR